MFYVYETINGVANEKVFGNGIMSNEVSHKKLKKVILITSNRVGNIIEFYLEQEKVFETTDIIANVNSDNLKQEYELDIEIPVGQKIVPALSCGGTATNLTVIYQYEEIR